MCRPEPAAVKVQIAPNLFNVEDADKEFHTSHSCLQLEMALVEEKKGKAALGHIISVMEEEKSWLLQRLSELGPVCFSNGISHFLFFIGQKRCFSYLQNTSGS